MSELLRRFGVVLAVLTGAFLLVLPTMLPFAHSSDAWAIPAWSRKYDVNCQMCHSPLFARLNAFGERFQANGYQHPDLDKPDGDDEGKKKYGSMLALDNEVGHWFTARFNLTPIQIETKAAVVNGDTTSKITIGNTNWLQLFVAGSLMKNVSMYIENEITPTGIHQAWYYLGLHNLGNTPWLNFQFGRLSSVVFAPYPDRLPQLPAVGGPGITRVATSAGAGAVSMDLRSARYGIQYYGHGGPLTLYAGVSPGTSSSNAANALGYWAGVKASISSGGPAKLVGSSIGVHVDGGTDRLNPANPDTTYENAYTRIMPSLNLRWADKIDLQAAYVMVSEDNRRLLPETANPEAVSYGGIRTVGSYILNDHWALSFHYDMITASDDDKANLAAGDPLQVDYSFLYIPVITYLYRENFRVSFYPGIDLRDEADLPFGQKHNLFFINIRTAI